MPLKSYLGFAVCVLTLSPIILKVPEEQLEYFDCSGLGQKDCSNGFIDVQSDECRIYIYGDLDTGLPSLSTARLPRLTNWKL